MGDTLRQTGDQAPTVTFGRAGRGGLLLAAAPLGAAIGVFGVIFGASASTQMDFGLALAFSLLVFSGSLQFATLGLLAGGAGPLAVVVTALALNARHLVLGAVVRPYLEASRARRAVMAWFLLDESFGLAIASKERAEFVLVVSGVVFYICWAVGTLLGLLGAQAVGLSGLAEAIFPVLFIGLCALTVRSRADAARAVLAAGVVFVLASLVPPLEPFAPVIAALAIGLIGRQPA